MKQIFVLFWCISALHASEALFYCIRDNNPQELQQLIDGGCDINMPLLKGDSTALSLAVKYNHLQTVELLLKNQAQHTKPGWPLYTAARQGHNEMVQLLLKYGYSTDVISISDLGDDYYPLHAAAENGHPEVISTLINHGAKVNQQRSNGETPLHRAAWCGKLKSVEKLIEYGALVDACDVQGNSCIWKAIQGFENSPQVVATLLKHGADPCRVPIGCYSSLHRATHGGHEEITKMLVEYTTLINLKESQEGMTPLHFAVENAHPALIRILREHGADMTIKDNQGRTPQDCLDQLTWAENCDVSHLLLKIARFEREDASHILQSKGYSINMESPIGHITALHEAAKKGYTKIVKSLVAAGANKEALDGFKKRPIDYARDPEIKAMLA